MPKLCKLPWTPFLESGRMKEEREMPLLSLFSFLLALYLQLKPVDLVIYGF